MEFTAEMIASFLGGEITGDKDAKVTKLSSIEEGEMGMLTYLSNPKYEPFIYTTKASIVLVDSDFSPTAPVEATIIKVESAAASILKLLQLYNASRPKRSGVSPMAYISADAEVAEGAYVGEFSVVEAGAKIASGVQIYPQCFVGEGATIGENSILYAGVKVYEGCHIQSNVILHSGAVIGADGFGFAPNAEGGFDKIPQLGNVIIEDNVEIGANTCVDRAKTNSTIIRRGVKLDNLIQVGHNVTIGENTVSSAQTGVAGSTTIGSNCYIGGQVGIGDHVKIGNRVMIASKSGVEKSVPDGEIRMGYPALPGIQFHRSAAVVKVLPEIARKVRELSKKVDELTPKE